MTTPIESIQLLREAVPAAGKSVQANEANRGMFADIFETAIRNVRETDAEKNRAEYLLATGQLDNPAELTIAGTKAQLSVDLLVQLRNKALDAYTELTRISL